MSEAKLYRRDALILGAALALILIVVFSPFLLGNKSIMASAGDVPSIYLEGAVVGHSSGHYRGLDQGASGWQTEPAFAETHRIMFEEHRLPFWEPDGAYGKPWLGAMVPQPFYPPSTMVALHPSPRMEAWWVAARLWIAGFFAALFVRLFFRSRSAAAAAGIAAMFAGYFLLYYDMPHLSVEVELPMLLWAVEILSRKISARRIAALSAAVALVVLGGMPESAVLALLVATLYAFLRLVTLPGARLPRIAALAGACVVGLSLGAIELVPFVELINRGASDHDPSMLQGLGYDPGWRYGLITELFPRLFGNPYESIFTNGFGFSGTRGFLGMTGLFFALVAVVTAWRKRDGRTGVVSFLALIALYFVLKRFGSPLVNWTGGLPLLVQIQFAKYGEAELACATALLVGFGLGYLRERHAGLTSIATAFSLIITLSSYLFLCTHEPLPPGPASDIYPHAVAIGLIVLFIAAAAAIIGNVAAGPLRRASTIAMLAVLVAEPFVAYLYPALFRYAPSITQNPYAGAPYIAFLQQHMQPTRERLMGVNAMLFPNWASAFDLNDVRSIEAVTVHDYLPFVDAFVATTPATSDDQYDRFVSSKPIDVNRALVKRWLALSSVGYLVSPTYSNMVASPKGSILGPLLDQAYQQIPAADQVAVHEEAVELGGIAEATFFEHPPHDITYRTSIPKGDGEFTADLALKPGSYNPVVLCGGPVTFDVRAYQAGALVASATRTIDPKHVMSERRWIPLTLDLSKSAGRSVDLHLRTSATDTCAAWAVWGEPRFIPAHSSLAYRHNALIFPVVYRAPGVNIFRVPDSLSRLTLFHHAEKVASFKDAISALRRPSFDIRTTAVVDGALPKMAPASGHDSVTVTFSRSDRLEATVVAGSDALLMENDTWYPGWKATVDGHAAPIVRTDGYFRGIPVAAGRHSVVIAYDSPVALVGMLFSLLGLLTLVILLAVPLPVRRTRPVSA